LTFARSRAISAQDCCSGDKVGNVLVFSSPKVCRSGALCPNTASRNRDCLADTWAAAPLLVTSFGEVEMEAEDIGHPRPISLDLAQPRRNSPQSLEPAPHNRFRFSPFFGIVWPAHVSNQLDSLFRLDHYRLTEAAPNKVVEI
jgi:hypothetical protein